MYFVYWPYFFKLIVRMFTPRYFRIRFVLFVGCLIIPLIMTFKVITMVFQGLDYIFFPGFRHQKIEAPVFIFSNPRSGSTFLHRLLEKDAQFTYMTLWQSLLNSVILYKLVGIFTAIDKLMGRPIFRLLDAIDRFSFDGWEGIHKAGLQHSEEDEYLFVKLFLTPGLIIFFPYLREVEGIYDLDTLPEKARKKLVKHTQRSLQRHVYATGGKTLLAKNAVAGGRLGIYREAFPDMKMIYIHRDFQECVASSLSLFTKLWKVHSPECYKREYENMSVVEMVRTNHEGIMRYHCDFDDGDITDIEYQGLIDDPEAVIKNIYQHFGLSMNVSFSEVLAADCDKARSYKSTHTYTLEDYGFTPDQLESHLEETANAAFI